jgi:hypothetical protein
VTIHDPLHQLQNLRAALVANGVAVTEDAASTQNAVWVSSTLDNESNARLSQGGTVLLLASGPEAVTFAKPFEITPRAGSDLNGDWVSNFNWALPSSPIWKPLVPVIDSGILGWEAASVTPDFVIGGVREPDPSTVLAGVFYGWLNSNRAYLVDMPEDPGRLLITTFRFQAYGHDPFATILLHQILKVAAVTPGKT